MIPKKTIAAMLKRIDKHMASVAKERDKLDETISELESLKEDCDNAWNCLQDARDALSEMV